MKYHEDSQSSSLTCGCASVTLHSRCSEPPACSLHGYGKNTKTYCSAPREEGQLHSSAQASRHSITPRLRLLSEVCRHRAENRGLFSITTFSGAPQETCSFPAVAISMAQRIFVADTTKCQAKNCREGNCQTGFLIL